MKILIVEDSDTQLKLIKSLLEKNNLFTDVAKDGKTAISILKENDHQLVILDLMLPDIQGIEILKKIKKTNQELPVFVISSKKKNLDQEIAFRNGANEFFTKPVNFDVLLEKINKIKGNE